MEIVAQDNGPVADEAAVVECVHHWVLTDVPAQRLSRDVLSRHPNCIGRPSTCKRCGATKLQTERVWDSWG